MSEIQFDYMKESDICKVAISHFFRSYNTGITGMSMSHIVHAGCETPEMISQQHNLFIHLMPELRSERRIDNRLQSENVNVGDIAIVPAHATHWQGIEQESVEGIVISLEPHMLTNLVQEAIQPSQIELLPTFAQPDPLIYGIGLNLKLELEANKHCASPYAKTLIDTLFFHLLKNYSVHSPVFRECRGGLSRDRLRTAIDYIQSNLAEELSLRKIAQEINISHYHFISLFKQSMGITPYQYVMQQRIKRAQELLSDRKLSISEISLACGFANQSHFTRLFRKHTGESPKAYRDR